MSDNEITPPPTPMTRKLIKKMLVVEDDLKEIVQNAASEYIIEIRIKKVSESKNTGEREKSVEPGRVPEPILEGKLCMEPISQPNLIPESGSKEPVMEQEMIVISEQIQEPEEITESATSISDSIMEQEILIISDQILEPEDISDSFSFSDSDPETEITVIARPETAPQQEPVSEAIAKTKFNLSSLPEAKMVTELFSGPEAASELTPVQEIPCPEVLHNFINDVYQKAVNQVQLMKASSEINQVQLMKASSEISETVEVAPEVKRSKPAQDISDPVQVVPEPMEVEFESPQVMQNEPDEVTSQETFEVVPEAVGSESSEEVPKRDKVIQNPVVPELIEEVLEPVKVILEAAEDVAKPAEDVAKPAEEVAEPAEDVAEPAEEVAEPAEDVEEPAEDVAEPAEEVAEPAEEVPESAEEVAEPAEEVAESAEEVAEPAEEVAESAEEVAESAEDVAEPAEDVAKPTEYVAEPAEEVAEPAEEVPETPEVVPVSVQVKVEHLVPKLVLTEPVEDVPEYVEDISEDVEDISEPNEETFNELVTEQESVIQKAVSFAMIGESIESVPTQIGETSVPSIVIEEAVHDNLQPSQSNEDLAAEPIEVIPDADEVVPETIIETPQGVSETVSEAISEAVSKALSEAVSEAVSKAVSEASVLVIEEEVQGTLEQAEVLSEQNEGLAKQIEDVSLSRRDTLVPEETEEVLKFNKVFEPTELESNTNEESDIVEVISEIVADTIVESEIVEVMSETTGESLSPSFVVLENIEISVEPTKEEPELSEVRITPTVETVLTQTEIASELIDMISEEIAIVSDSSFLLSKETSKNISDEMTVQSTKNMAKSKLFVSEVNEDLGDAAEEEPAELLLSEQNELHFYSKGDEDLVNEIVFVLDPVEKELEISSLQEQSQVPVKVKDGLVKPEIVISSIEETCEVIEDIKKEVETFVENNKISSWDESSPDLTHKTEGYSIFILFLGIFIVLYLFLDFLEKSQAPPEFRVSTNFYSQRQLEVTYEMEPIQ